MTDLTHQHLRGARSDKGGFRWFRCKDATCFAWQFASADLWRDDPYPTRRAPEPKPEPVASTADGFEGMTMILAYLRLSVGERGAVRLVLDAIDKSEES